MKTVLVGLGTCGISAGGEKVYRALQEELKEHPGAFELKETGCIGMCYREPLVEIIGWQADRPTACASCWQQRLYAEVTTARPLKVGRLDKKYIICNADEGDPGAFMDALGARGRSAFGARGHG
jgi:hypothetical protein